MDARWSDLPRPNGYYCTENFAAADLPTALMAEGNVFARLPDGGPDIQHWHGFHVENRKLVDALETVALHLGVVFLDGKVAGDTHNAAGDLEAVRLEDGRSVEADFFVDASGFRAELLGQTLEEPLQSFERALFCDRAVVGGWERGPDEPIKSYTTAEMMDAGWSWQIEHEHHVNRGYVYSSDHLSDGQARAEFLARNPKAPADARTVKFRSGRRRRLWVNNVAAIGNAAGFVEPLEATAIMIITRQCLMLVESLLNCGLDPTDSIRDLYNTMVGELWDEVRDFLALHYKLNTLRDTPFWQRCRQETDLGNILTVPKFYEENGPSGLGRHLLCSAASSFGIEGFLVMLVGNRVPYRGTGSIGAAEQATWEAHRRNNVAVARAGLNVKDALAAVRDPRWRWHDDPK